MYFSENDFKKLKAFHVITKLSIQIFNEKNNKIKAYHSGIMMAVPYVLPNWKKKSAVIQFDDGFLKESFLSIHYKDSSIVIGPWLTKPITDSEIDILIHALHISKAPEKTKLTYQNYYDSLPIYSLGDIRDLLILMGFLLGINLESVYSSFLHDCVTENSLKLDDASRPSLNEDRFHTERYSFDYESRILSLVAKGDLTLLKRGIADIGGSVRPEISLDSLRNEKNYTIMMMEKLASFAISSGNDILKSIQIRDFYVRKVESKKSMADVLAVRESAIIHFTKEMHNLVHTIHSPTVLSAIQIINLTIYNPIKVSDLSKKLHLSESRLRNIFKSEMNMNISEYINQRRITESKIFLLLGIPPKKVAKQLNFFDLSHYCRMFKKYEGITPKEFQTKTSIKKTYKDIEV